MNNETPKTTKEKADVMLEYTERKEAGLLNGPCLQVRPLSIRKVWENYSFEPVDPCWNWEVNDYRIKPEQKTRPFRFEDLPDGPFWVRKSGGGAICGVEGVSKEIGGIYLTPQWYTFTELAQYWSYSTSLHGPWLPFTKEEDEE